MSKKTKVDLVFNINCKKETREYLAGIADSLMKYTSIVIHRTNSSSLNMMRALEELKGELTNKNIKNMKFDSIKILMVKMGHLKVPFITAHATVHNIDCQYFIIDKEMKKTLEDSMLAKINEVLEGFSDHVISINLIE